MDEIIIELKLNLRGVSCLAKLHPKLAPKTVAAVLEAIPITGDAWHAKYSSNEVYTLIAPIVEEEIGLENPTITPAAGELVYWDVPGWMVPQALASDLGLSEHSRFADLAVFYARNNLILNPSCGYIPGNVFGEVVENLTDFAAACNDVWRSGSAGESLTFRRQV